MKRSLKLVAYVVILCFAMANVKMAHAGSGDSTVIIAASAGAGAVVLGAGIWYLVWHNKKANAKTVIYIEANQPLIEYKLKDSVSLSLDPDVRGPSSTNSLSMRDLEGRDLLASKIALHIRF